MRKDEYIDYNNRKRRLTRAQKEIDAIETENDRRLEAEEFTLSSSLRKYSEDDIVDIANSKLGASISGQLRDILDGEKFSEQNSNALKEIELFLRAKDEDEVADDIKQYLKLIDYKRGRLGI